MALYRITNEVNLRRFAKRIVRNQSRSKKYRYNYYQVLRILKNYWPKKGQCIELSNAQCTAFHTPLFSHWGNREVGYTYCLSVNKWKDPDTGERLCTVGLGTQQTVGRAFYGISPVTASEAKQYL